MDIHFPKVVWDKLDKKIQDKVLEAARTTTSPYTPGNRYQMESILVFSDDAMNPYSINLRSSEFFVEMCKFLPVVERLLTLETYRKSDNELKALRGSLATLKKTLSEVDEKK